MLKIDDNWALGADERNWILYRAQKGKKQPWRPCYYFPTLEALTEHYITLIGRIELSERALDNLKALTQALTQANADMAETLRVLSLGGKDWRGAMAKKLKEPKEYDYGERVKKAPPRRAESK